MFVVRHGRRGLRRELGRRPSDPHPWADDRRPSATSTPRSCGARTTSTRTGSSCASRPRHPPAAGRCRDLRHHAARRRAVRGHLAHRRGQAAHRRAARLARRGLDRRRLPAGQPEGRRVLPAGGHRALAVHGHPRGLRLHAPAGGQGRCRPHPRRPRRRRHLHRVHRRQVVGLPRHRGAPDHARRGRGHGGGLRRLPEGGGAAGVLRRRALLRRVQGQRRVRPAGARGRRHQRRRLPRAVRHERRIPAPRGGAHRRRGVGLLRRRPAPGHPHAERLRVRGGQLHRRRPGGRHAAPRDDQRLRRAHRQRQPHDLHPEPRVEARMSAACPKAACPG